MHVSCVFCLCCGSQFEGHFLNEKKLTARCNTSVCGQTMDPKLGPNIGFKFGATCGLKMRPRSVSRGPILGSIVRPRFGVRLSFSLRVAPKWGPKYDPHFGAIFPTKNAFFFREHDHHVSPPLRAKMDPKMETRLKLFVTSRR